MEGWIVDPFRFEVGQLPDDEIFKEELIEFRTNRDMKMEFESKVLQKSCKTGFETYRNLAEKTLSNSPSFF